jgi:RHS repeat-associated protein
VQEYDLEYAYNLAGQLISEKYPSGRFISTEYDANGRLASTADTSRTYLSGIAYQGKGNSLNQMALGNGTMQTISLNDRLQMTGQELKRGAETLQKYDYGFGQIDAGGNLDATKNNGQLARVESYIGTTKQWTQKFAYDSVGRLKESEERRGDTNALSYKQTFDFDRFGNLYRKTANNLATGQESPLPFTPIEEGDISKSKNQLASQTVYDDAGNVTQDTKFRGINMAYDANGRIYASSNTAGGNQANAVYDASGQRVATQVNSVWTYFVYDIDGKTIAEYGGQPSTDDDGVKYALKDWQGSSRGVINNAGYAESRTDYTAFGEEISAGTGLRTTGRGFGRDSDLSQKYALTERDNATGLDNTWFRKLENRAGRWTSPDPYGGSMSVSDPQSFNRYSYVQSDPTNFIDPSGLFKEGPGPRPPIVVPIYTSEDWCRLWGICPVQQNPPGGGGGGGGGGAPTAQTPQTGHCGVNPVTATRGINPVNSGTLGELRPGLRGGGYFGAPRNNAGRRYTHTGSDIAAPVGSPVVAFAPGRVTSISGSATSSSGYGLMVTIDHGNGYTSRYAHLSNVNGLAVGQLAGSPQTHGIIGSSGQSGNAYGQPAAEAHLHFEIRKNGTLVNPEKFLNSSCPNDFPNDYIR